MQRRGTKQLKKSRSHWYTQLGERVIIFKTIQLWLRPITLLGRY